MKIIHVTQFLGIGGLEKIIFHLILEQKKAGHQVQLYVYDYDRDWVDYFKKNNIEVILPPVKSSGIDFFLFMRMNHDLMNCDVIHSHDMNPLFYLGPLVRLRRLLFLKTPKYVHTTHGMAHIERVPRYRYFEKILAPLADKIICVSKKLGNFYIENLKINSNKIRVIENGIKTLDETISPELKLEKKSWLVSRHNLNLEQPIFICLSRVLPLKDQLFLVKAFAKRPNYQLLIVGPCADDSYLKELIQNKSANTYIVGAQELVNDYNLGSDVFVSASTHEGIPVAVLEAMACETPSLVSKIPGHLTLNQYGNVLEFFELLDTEYFLKASDKILANKIEYTQKAIEARKVVEENFSVKKMVNEYLEEYQNV
jgi:glycosyltransferase involved in cell wall biosynthesis